MNKYTFLFVLCFGFLSAFSKNNTPVKGDSINNSASYFLSISPSYQYLKYIDQQISPLLYKGSLAGLHLAFESDQRLHKYNISLSGFYGVINGKTKYVSYQATQGDINLTGYYLHAFRYQKEKLNTYIGALIKHEFIIHYNTNLQNAASTKSFMNHLALSAEIEKYLSWHAKTIQIWFLNIKRRKRLIKLNFKLDLPLIFYNKRPPYSTISDFSDGENLWSSEAQSYFIGFGAFQLNTNTSLTYYLGNRNAFRLSYQWQVFKFNELYSNYQMAQHIVQFSLLFRFN